MCLMPHDTQKSIYENDTKDNFYVERLFSGENYGTD